MFKEATFLVAMQGNLSRKSGGKDKRTISWHLGFIFHWRLYIAQNAILFLRICYQSTCRDNNWDRHSPTESRNSNCPAWCNLRKIAQAHELQCCFCWHLYKQLLSLFQNNPSVNCVTRLKFFGCFCETFKSMLEVWFSVRRLGEQTEATNRKFYW